MYKFINKFLTPAKTGRSMSPDCNTVNRHEEKKPPTRKKDSSTLRSKNDNHPHPLSPNLKYNQIRTPIHKWIQQWNYTHTQNRRKY